MPHTATIKVTVTEFNDAVDPNNPVAFSKAIFEKEPGAADDNRVVVDSWRIAKERYCIIRIEKGTTGTDAEKTQPVELTFKLFDIDDVATTYVFRRFDFEQKPTHRRSRVRDPGGIQTFSDPVFNAGKNEAVVTNNWNLRSEGGVYWELYIQIKGTIGGKRVIGVIDPGIENAE